MEVLMLTEQYPPNSNYEYLLDDILLIINCDLIKRNYQFKHVINSNQFRTLMNDDGLTVNVETLPCYPKTLAGGETLLYKGFKIVLCGDSQSFDFSETSLGKFIKKAICETEKYICIFPLHFGFSSGRQGGHWNITALEINNKKAKLTNYEPLGEDKSIENDPAIVKDKFYISLQSALQGFSLRQVTIQTAQQSDHRLCGAIAAANAAKFWGDMNVLSTKYSISGALLLRGNHIILSNSENFAKRQFTNWVFEGYKNDDYEKANGEAIWHELRKLQLISSEEYQTNFANFIAEVNKKWLLAEARQCLQWLANFFIKHGQLLAQAKVDGKLLVLKFFKEVECKELVSSYNVIEVVKCLAKRFETVTSKQSPAYTSVTDSPQPYKRYQGYSNTYRGDEYQKLVGMHYALNLYLERVECFKIITESAEKTCDFGKFDDLIIETKDRFEVIQVKHAGSIDENKRLYTVDMLAATKDSKKDDIQKKAALHSYYDSWRNCKDKDKPVTFRFYTNHQLNDNLKQFYNTESAQYLSLLEPQHDAALQAIQKKLFDSIYQESEYFDNNMAKSFTHLVFIIKAIEENLWKQFIDDNYQLILSTLSKGGNFRKTQEISIDKYQKIAFLLIGLFNPVPSEDAIGIKVPDNYFDPKPGLKPIHKYLYEKLSESCKKPSKLSVIGNQVTFTMTYLTWPLVMKILFPTEGDITNIIFLNKASVRFDIYSQHAMWCLSLLCGISLNEIPYDLKINYLGNHLVDQLASAPNLPKCEFTDVASLDPTIHEFIKAFNFHIDQPSISELEKRNYERIKQHFQVEDHTYYLMFERYFLENFREPLGEEITFHTIDNVFQKAKREIQRSRLVGYVERYLEQFKKVKLKVVDQDQLNIFNIAFQSSSNVVTLVSGQPHIGKSFTVLEWIEQYGSELQLLEDDYAFLPMRDVWEKDIELFIDKLKLLVIDNIEEVFDDVAKQQLLFQFILAAKEHRKKIILIIAEHKKNELAAMVSGIPHKIIDCQPLTNKQIYAFGFSLTDFLVIGNLVVQLNDLLTKQEESGLAMALRNPGLLLSLKGNNYFAPEKPVSKSDEPSSLFVKQNMRLKQKVNFYQWISQIQSSVLIYHSRCEDRFLKSLKEQSGVSIIDINKSILPNQKKGKRFAILCGDLNTLPPPQLEKFQERDDLLVFTSSKEFFQIMSGSIKHQCHAPDKNKRCKIIETSLAANCDLWEIEETNKDYIDFCRQKELFVKRTLVSADAGMGKSTLVKRLCQTQTPRKLIASSYHWRVPIYLDQLVASDTQKNLNQFIFDIIKKRYKLSDFFRAVIDHDLAHGNVLLLLDGGDQIKEEQLLECRELYQQLVAYSHVIFLTRPTQSRLSFNLNQELMLLPFADEQIEEYFHKAFPEPVVNPFFNAATQFMRDNNQLRDMLGIPLQCYLFWQAWQPYYDQWQQNNEELVIPKHIVGNTALIAIFQRFLESKFYIHFNRNFKINGPLLEQRERVNTLSIGYIERFMHVAVYEHFSDIRPFLQLKIPQPLPQEWLDNDIEQIALIKRTAAPKHGAVSYVMAHRTYQEYAAAKYFVEGLMGLRQMHPDQKKWCKELLSVARYVHIYQQFWRFVLNWIQHHISLHNLPSNTLNIFEQYFKSNGDLINAKENDFWDCLILEKRDFPLSYIPASIPNRSEDNDLDTDLPLENLENETKIFADFNDIEKIIKGYQGPTFMRRDSEVCQAIQDLPNHNDIAFERRIALLKHAHSPDGKMHDSSQIHVRIVLSLCHLGDDSPTLWKLLFSYYDYYEKQKSFLRTHVLEAAKTIKVTEENINKFLQLLKKIQDLKELDLDTLEVINHVFSSIFTTKLGADKESLYQQFEGLFIRLKELDWSIRLDTRSYTAIKDFVKILKIFGKCFTADYIRHLKSYVLPVMIIYAQNGESLFGNELNKEDKEKVMQCIQNIPKDTITSVVMLMSSQGSNAFLLLKTWLGINYNDNFNSLDFRLCLKHIQHLQNETETLKTIANTYADIYVEIDGAIPATCELHQGFNVLMAAYLLSLMDNEYWQYPIALVSNIPRLLKYHIDNGIYPHLALHVYQECLRKIVIVNNYGDLFEKFFNNVYVDAYGAMDYAWQIYTETGSDKASLLIFDWAAHLQWPIFKASQTLSLHVVTPGTGRVKEFKADDSHLDSAIMFFKKAREVQDQADFFEQNNTPTPPKNSNQ